VALLGQERGQVRRGDIDEVAKHVHIAVVAHGGDFDAGDERDARRRAGGRCGVASADSVVIGHGDHGDSGR
jgi:hypothetical protein